MLHSKMSKTKKQKQNTNSSPSKSEIIDREFLDGVVKRKRRSQKIHFQLGYPFGIIGFYS